MKKLILTLVTLGLAQSSVAAINSQNTIKLIEDSIQNTERTLLISSINTQITESIDVANNIQMFLRENQGMLLSDFTSLYKKVMLSGRLRTFKFALKTSDGKSFLIGALRHCKKSVKRCFIKKTSFKNDLNQITQRVEITIPSVFYGKEHWVPSNTSITDTYYILEKGNQTSIQDIELGLLRQYTESANNELAKIKNKINNEYI